MILVIQTNIPGQLSVWLFTGRGIFIDHRLRNIKPGQISRLTETVDQMLVQKKKRLAKVEKIIVVRGPGPFTAVRTGLIFANTISWINKKAVSGIVSDKLLSGKKIVSLIKSIKPTANISVKPYYGRAPNITKAKRSAGIAGKTVNNMV